MRTKRRIIKSQHERGGSAGSQMHCIVDDNSESDDGEDVEDGYECLNNTCETGPEEEDKSC